MVVIVTLLWQNLSKSAFNYKLSLIDTFGDVGSAIAFGDVWDAISFGDVGYAIAFGM